MNTECECMHYPNLLGQFSKDLDMILNGKGSQNWVDLQIPWKTPI